MDSRSILGLQRVRPSFLDHVSAAEAGRGGRSSASTRGRSTRRHASRAGRRARVISHEMSRDYVLEYPIDDPDEEDDDDVDEDDEGEEDEDGDEEEVETWQVFETRTFR